MGKQGPCYHCGVTSTPLWRNGPPEKPVLCNACGSRWRTKGTLVNYTPLHSRAEPDELEDHRFSRMKNINIPIKNKDTKILKRKQIYDNPGPFFEYNHVPSKLFDEDTSNRSSSGSAVSNSESCAQFNSTDASDLTGPSQGNAWDTSVPSRKRTCVSRSKASSVEKLTKDLYTILHEQQSSYLSGSSEEELLFDSDKPMVSVEIGHGSVLIRHPSSIARDEESEASSLSVDNKRVRTNLTTMPHVNMLNKGVKVANIGTEIMKKPSGLSLDHEQIKRDKDHLEKLHILGHHTSPLCKVDLKEFLNFETFVTHLTIEEQQSLLKYLPSTDNFAPPDSLKNMFESTQFSENISSFQNLLSEGVFDNTLSGAKLEDCKTLKRFILCNLNKSKWVEKCTLLKDVKSKMTSDVANPIIPTGYSVNVKKPRDGQFANIAGAKTFIKSPKRMIKTEQKEPIDNDGSFFSPKSLFALPPDNSSLYAESSDHDLLLDIPSNSFFPQAELLNVPSSSYGGQGSNSSSSGSGSGSVYPPHLVRR